MSELRLQETQGHIPWLLSKVLILGSACSAMLEVALVWWHFGTALGGGLRDCMLESLSRRGGFEILWKIQISGPSSGSA